MTRPRPIPTIRRDRAPSVALWLIFLFTAGTAGALLFKQIF